MKYICKKDLPFAKRGEEVEIRGNDNCRDGSTWIWINERIGYRWSNDWSAKLEEWFDPKRWRAEKFGMYWYVDARGFVDSEQENHDMQDDSMWRTGNYFQTKEQAEKARLLVIEALKKAHE